MFTGGVQPAQDELSEGRGKVLRSSWAQCSRRPYVLLMAHRSGELHLTGALAITLHSDIT